MTLVRTTLWPDREVEVDDAEYLDLQRQGLLVEETATTDQPDAPAPTKADTKSAKGGES